jgi:hypothetical protein
MRPYVALTILLFLGPATVMGMPDAATEGAAVVFRGLNVLLLAVLILGLALVAFWIYRSGGSMTSRSRFLLLGAVILAAANAARIGAGVELGGLAVEILVAVWFAAPFALVAAALWPKLKGPSWWTAALRWTLLAFPLAFLVAGLGRIDFFFHTGVRLPVYANWAFAYVPFLIIAGVTLLAWLAFTEARGGLRRQWKPVTVLLVGGAVGVAASFLSTASFILSAYVTWGSGYQLFRTPPPLATHTLSFALGALAVTAFLLVVREAHRHGLALPLFVILAAVLSGIHVRPESVLGGLLGLLLIWHLVESHATAVSRSGSSQGAATESPLDEAVASTSESV